MKEDTHNLFSRLGNVDQIPQQNDLSMSGQSPRWNGPWTLLQRHFLIVAVHSLLRIDAKRSSGFTTRAITNLDFLVGVLEKGAKDSIALATVKLDVFELREHTGASSHHARDLDEAVEVVLSEFS